MSVSSSTTVRSLLLNCSYCGQLADVMDHVTPLHELRSWDSEDWNASLIRHWNDPMNLTPACGSCNRAKASKSIDRWLAEMILSHIDTTGAIMPSNGTVLAARSIRRGDCADWVREAYVSILQVLTANLAVEQVDA